MSCCLNDVEVRCDQHEFVLHFPILSLPDGLPRSTVKAALIDDRHFIVAAAQQLSQSVLSSPFTYGQPRRLG